MILVHVRSRDLPMATPMLSSNVSTLKRIT